MDGKLQDGKYVGISGEELAATWPHFSWVSFCFKAMCLDCLKVFLMVWEALRFRPPKFHWGSVNNKRR